MTTTKRKHVARTEDRVKHTAPVCAYAQCQGRLKASQIAEGDQYCDNECWHADLMDSNFDPQEDDE